MQKIKNVYVDVYCIRDGMVHIFFVWGQGTRRKMYVLKFCVHTKFLQGGNVLTIMGFQSIMMAGELGGNIG